MSIRESGGALILLLAVLPASGQPSSVGSGDPLLDRLKAIAEDFDRQVRAAGFAGAGAAPSIVVDSRPQLSMYTRTDNTVHASRWEEASPDAQEVFARWAGYAGDRTAKQLFDEMFHRFFFVHELAHWLQVQAKRDSDDVYGFELEANRLTVAYWREKDPEYLTAVVSRLRRINEALTSPVPAGQVAEAYFNANYRNLGSNPNVYGWFQTRMVIAAGSERPAGTFAEIVQRLSRR